MYKKIPGNCKYKISLNKKIVSEDGTEGTLPITEDKVFITIFDKQTWVDLTWLSLISHYEISLSREQTFNISFTDINRTVTDSFTGKLMIIKKPIIVNGKYRIIPGFTDYAISENGELIDTYKFRIIPRFNRGKRNYPEVYIYSPEKSSYRHIKVHRLVALAWVHNSDHLCKCVVNHKDGNKQNFIAKNLEWCTYSENANHAYSENLRTDNVRCKVRNIFTKEIIYFDSLTKAGKYIGLNYPLRIQNVKTTPKLISDKFEIKFDNDDTKWFYEKLDKPFCVGRYTLEVIYPDSTIDVFYDVRSLIKKLKIWNVFSVVAVIEKAKKLYPGIEIKYIDNYHIKPVQALNIISGEIYEANTFSELSRKTGINKGKINKAVKRNDNSIIGDFVFRYKIDSPWNTKYTYSFGRSMCLLATNKLDNKTLTFKSVNDTARHFNCDKSIISRCLKKNVLLDNWSFKENRNHESLTQQ